MIQKKRLFRGNYGHQIALWAVFLLSFSYFLFLQSAPFMSDPDGFYHAKIAQLMSQGAWRIDFVWLPLTYLKDYFADQHFLYHVFLIPFVKVIDPLWGVKIAAAFFAALASATFAWLLKQFGVRHYLSFTFLLLVIRPFVFRLNLAKAFPLALIIVFLALYCLFAKRARPFFFLGWLYVWIHGSWPLLLVIQVIAVFNFFLYQAGGFRAIPWSSAMPRLKKRLAKALSQSRYVFYGMMYSVLGIAAGIVTHPYFPQNIFFYWLQIYQIAVVNFQKVINVGVEWIPYTFSALLGAVPIVWFALLLGVLVVIYAPQRPSWWETYLVLLSSFFFFMLFRAQRHIEFFVPVIVLFMAVVWQRRYGLIPWKRVGQWWLMQKAPAFTAVFLVALYLTSSVVYIAIRDARVLKTSFSSYFSFQEYQGAGRWLQDNTRYGEAVFHTDWSEFPMLFYYNDKSRYVAGLDPTFFYYQNPELYTLWTRISGGAETRALAPFFTKQFLSPWVVVRKGAEDLQEVLAVSPDFELVFVDEYASIYKVKQQGKKD